jgi:glycosyltransferase involved in cell wall biosynthesis
MANNEMLRKILQYNPRFYPIIGGGELYIANIVRGIKEYYFDIITNALSGYPLRERFSNNAQVLRFLPYDWNLISSHTKKLDKALFPYRLLSDIIRLRKKYAYLKKSKFDLLHVHGIGFEVNFLRVDSWLKFPILTKLIDFTFVSAPKLLTMHNLISPFMNNSVAKKFEHHIIDQFDNIIAVDKNIQSYVEEYVEDTNQDKKIWFIPNSVDTKLFTFTEAIENKKLKIGFIGRLERSRGLKLLYNLIRNLPDYVEMHVIGAGSATYMDRFKSNIDISKIHFYKNVKNEDIPKILSKVDVLFNPVLAEGISRITLEAMSCGRPVIMLDKGDRYPIMHNHTGYLISENTIELFELLQYLQDNKNELQKIGKNARKIVEREFSNDVVIPEIKKVYIALME